MLEAIIAGLFALTGAFSTLAYQHWRDRRQRIQHEKNAEITRRMSIISDLVANRFVLTAGRASSRGVYQFNRALNRIPIEFIDDKDVLDKYRKIGSEFNSEKIGSEFNSERFHLLIISLIKSTREIPGHVDVHLLENVPSVTNVVPDFSISINNRDELKNDDKNKNSSTKP